MPPSFRAGLPGPPTAWETKFPWEAKQAKAYFRGTPYCGIHRFGRCSRYVLPRLAHEGRAPLLDVGLVEYEPSHDSERHLNRSLAPLTKAPREPPEVFGKEREVANEIAEKLTGAVVPKISDLSSRQFRKVCIRRNQTKLGSRTYAAEGECIVGEPIAS